MLKLPALSAGLPATTFCDLDRIPTLIFHEFILDDGVEVETELAGEHDAVYEYISDFFMNMFPIVMVRLVVPLKALKQLCGLDADRFGEIAGSMELVPVAVRHEFANHGYGGIGNHGFKCSGNSMPTSSKRDIIRV